MNRSTRFQALLGAVGAVAALGVAAQGCGAALTAGGAFGLSLLDNNTTTGPTDSAPRVTVTTPSGVVNDVVPIHFRLVDAEGDRASVTVEVRETGGTYASGVIAWVEGAQGTLSLEASETGTDHVFYWNTQGHPSLSTLAKEVEVRITPRSATDASLVGDPAETDPFEVHNEYISSVAARPTPAVIAPLDIAVEADGSVVVADPVGHRVIRLDAATGETALIAGTGEGGHDPGGSLGTETRLNTPTSAVAVSRGDGNSDILIADAGNGLIRRVDGATGFVTDVAGLGGDDAENALASDAAVAPIRLAADGANAYVLEADQAVRYIDLGTLAVTFPTGTAIPGVPAVPTTTVWPARVLSVVGQHHLGQPGAAGYSAFLMELTEAAGIARAPASGSPGSLLYLLEQPHWDFNTFRPLRMLAVNHGSGAVDFKWGSGGTLTLNSGDLAVVAESSGRPGQSPNPDTAFGDWTNWPPSLAPYGPRTLLGALGDAGLVALNLTGGTVDVLGTPVPAGGARQVVGDGKDGGPAGGGDGLPPAAAAVDKPIGVAIDPTGNVFIGEENGRIRVVASASGDYTLGSPTPILTVPAGRIGTLPVQIPGLAPALVGPAFVSLTPNGDLLVGDVAESADPRGRRVHRVAGATGRLTSLVGSGVPGYDPGPVDLADARFEFVAAPTVSADGELVVLADLGSALVRVANLSGSARAVAGVTIQPGQVAAIAGQGPTTATPPADRGDGGSPTAAWLVGPIAARFGPNGLIWIDDAIDARIRVINPTSAAVTVLGTTIQPNTIETVLGAAGSYLPGDPNGDGGPAQAAALSRLGVFTNFTPRGDLLVAEGLGFGKDAFGVVRYVNLGSTPVDLGAVTVQPGEIETVAGSGVAVTGPTTGDGGPASSATFRGVRSASLRSDGLLFVTDGADHRVRVVNLTDATLQLGAKSVAPGGIETILGSGAEGMVTGEGDLNGFAPGTNPAPVGDLIGGVALDDGRFFCSDPTNGAVLMANTSSELRSFGGIRVSPGRVAVVAGSRAGKERVNAPNGVALTSAGELFATDNGTGSGVLFRIDLASRILTRVAGTGDGDASVVTVQPATEQRFFSLESVVVQGDGDMVLLADERNIMLLNRTTDQTVGGTLCPAGSVAPLTDGGEDANAYDDVGTALIGGSLTLFRAADIDLVEGGSQILWIADGGGGGNHVLVCDLSSPLGDVEAVRVADAIPPSSMTVNGTLVSFPGGAFLTAGVLPGDLAYVNTAEYTVAAVPAEGTLVLTQDTGIVGSATVQIDVHGDATAVAAVAADRAFVAFRCQRSGVRGAVVRDLRVVGTGLVAEQTGGNGGVICGTGKWPWNGDHLLATTFNLGSVADLAYDAATQVLLIADEDHNRIVAVNTSASSVTFAGLAIGPGEARTVAGGGNGEGGYNGDAVPPSVALLNEPSGVAFGLDGWIYVADRGNGRVRRFQR